MELISNNNNNNNKHKVQAFFDLGNKIDGGLNYCNPQPSQRAYLQHPGLGRVQIVKTRSSSFDDALGIPTEGIKLHKRLQDGEYLQPKNLSDLQNWIAYPLLQHRDILFTPRIVANAAELRRLICLQTLNHVFRTRDLVLKNNTRISQDGIRNPTAEFRDQGFTRPKVLFLLPNRGSCFKIVEELLSISQPAQQENKSRFVSSFSRQGHAPIDPSKPGDFVELFSGNNDDIFRLGLKFTKNSVKFFSRFYASDIILASPLGLRRVIESDKETKMGADFLSSIELLILDQADALQMQNWAHVQFVFNKLNLIPEDGHGCDFSRVRKWYLDGNAKHMRQTIITAQYLTSEISSLFSLSQNMFGQIKICPNYEGVLDPLISQSFIRFEAPEPASDGDFRLRYFFRIMSRFSLRGKHVQDGGVLIVVPTYLEFVRISGHFRTLEIAFTSLHEYSSTTEVGRARANFMNGKYKVLIYTERLHHFRRYSLKGVRYVLMYRLPTNPRFYTEMLAFTRSYVNQAHPHVQNATLKAMFSKWDVLQLERIVGKARQHIMVTETADTFDFP